MVKVFHPRYWVLLFLPSINFILIKKEPRLTDFAGSRYFCTLSRPNVVYRVTCRRVPGPPSCSTRYGELVRNRTNTNGLRKLHVQFQYSKKCGFEIYCELDVYNLPMALGSPLKKRNKGHSPGELSVVLGPILCWATEVVQPMNPIKILPEM